MPKLVRALSFRAALDQKLVTIARAFGSGSEGARQCGTSYRVFARWRTHFPSAQFLQKIDDVYAMAVELLNDPELMRKRRATSKKIVSLAIKLRLSRKTVQQLQEQGLY
jgi:hypothetical protein